MAFSTAEPSLFVGAFHYGAPAMKGFEAYRLASPLPFLPSLPRFFRPAPSFVVQYPAGENPDFGKVVMFWVPLFGMIVTPAVGFLMMILAWLGHRRRSAEEVLLSLQVENCQLQNEKLRMELEQLRLEVTKSKIIICNH